MKKPYYISIQLLFTFTTTVLYTGCNSGEKYVLPDVPQAPNATAYQELLLADTLFKSGNIDSAVGIYKNVLDRQDQHGPLQILVEGSNTDSALGIYNHTPASEHKHNSPYILVEVYKKLGITEAEKANYKTTLRLFSQAKAIAEKNTETHSLIASTYTNLASVYILLNDYPKAIQHYELALKWTEQIPSTVTVEAIYGNMSIIFNRLQESDKAIYYLQKGEQLARANNNSEVLATVLLHKGTAYLFKQNYAMSDTAFKECLAISKEINIKSLIAGAYRGLGRSTLMQGNYADAIPLLEQAVSLTTNPYNLNTTYAYLADTYGKLDNYSQEIFYLKKALAIADSFHFTKIQRSIHEGLANAYNNTGNCQKALVHFYMAYKLADSVYKREKAETVFQIEARYRTAEKDKEIAVQKLTLSEQQSNLRKKNIWMIGFGGGALLLATGMGMLYYRYRNNLNKQRYQTERLRSIEHEQKLQQLIAIMKGEEKERNRIARELHDGIGSMMSNTQFNLKALSEEIPVLKTATGFERITGMLSQISEEVRNTSHKLMPDVLRKSTFKDALMMYCEALERGKNMSIDVQYYGDIEELSKETQLFLYRIVQELLQNIQKHAQADKATVQVMHYENELSITVEDNGIGFDIEKDTAKGIGLTTIMSRAEALKGFFSIHSDPGKGTTALVKFDYDKLLALSEKV